MTDKKPEQQRHNHPKFVEETAAFFRRSGTGNTVNIKRADGSVRVVRMRSRWR